MHFHEHLIGVSALSGAAAFSAFQQLPWEEFDPETDLLPLRAWLTELEAKNGVDQFHHWASDRLTPQLRLMHPYWHEDGMSAFALSPDGRYFATGSFVGEDFYAGGRLLIWEVATGRVVNELHIDGGMGWPDYPNTMQWHAQLPLLGCAYNTNSVGALNPFTGDWKVSANVTDGWSRPPAFCWTGDGKQLYVACWDPDAKYIESDKGPWNLPGNWVDMETGKSHGCGTGITPWGNALQPYKTCQGYNDHIVGVNWHDQLYASHPQRGIFWTRNSKGAWFGEQHFAYRDEAGELIVVDGHSLGEVWRIPAPNQLDCHLAFDNKGLLLVSIEKGRIRGIRDGNEVWALDFAGDQSETGWSQPSIRSSFLSRQGHYIGLLTSSQDLAVWQLGEKPESIFTIGDVPEMEIFLTDDGHLILAGEQCISFRNLNTGQLLSSYDLTPPERETPLMYDGQDIGEYTQSENVACPITVDGEQEWALVFEEGAVVIPEGIDPDTLFAYGFANRFSWPLRWWLVPEYASIIDLVADKHSWLPRSFELAFGQPKEEKKAEKTQKVAEEPSASKAKSSEGDGSLPLGGEETPQSLAAYYESLLDGLGKGWRFAVDERYGVLALWYLLEDDTFDPFPLLNKIESARTAIDWAVQCAWITLENGGEADAYLELVRKRLPETDKEYDSLAYSVAGGLMLRLGHTEEGEAWLKKGAKDLQEENNTGENLCPYLRALLLAGRDKEMLKKISKSYDDHSGFVDTSYGYLFLLSLVMFAERSTVEATFEQLGELEELCNHEALHLLEFAVLRFQAVEWIDKMGEWFSSISTTEDEMRAAVLCFLMGKEDEARAWFEERFNNPGDHLEDYIDFVHEFNKVDPEGAIKALLSDDFSASEALKRMYSDQEKWMRKYLFLLASNTRMTPERITKHFGNATQSSWACFGVLGVLDATASDDPDFHNLLNLAAEHAGKCTGEDARNAWTHLSVQALTVGLTDLAAEFKKKAKENCGKTPGEFDLEAMVEIYAEAGQFEEAYRTLLGIKAGSRNHRMDKLLKALMEAGEYTAVRFLVDKLDASDINARPDTLGKLLLDTGIVKMSHL